MTTLDIFGSKQYENLLDCFYLSATMHAHIIYTHYGFALPLHQFDSIRFIAAIMHYSSKNTFVNISCASCVCMCVCIPVYLTNDELKWVISCGSKLTMPDRMKCVQMCTRACTCIYLSFAFIFKQNHIIHVTISNCILFYCIFFVCFIFLLISTSKLDVSMYAWMGGWVNIQILLLSLNIHFRIGMKDSRLISFTFAITTIFDKESEPFSLQICY